MSNFPDRIQYPPRSAYRFTTLDLWRRFYGADPLYTSAAFSSSTARCYVPFLVTVPTVIKRLGVYNGSSISAGNLSDIGLFYATRSHFARIPHNPLLVNTGPFERTGTSVWQWQAILQGSITLAPGLYYLAFSQIDSSHVMRIAASGTSGANLLAGITTGVSFPIAITSSVDVGTTFEGIPVLGADGVTA